MLLQGNPLLLFIELSHSVYSNVFFFLDIIILYIYGINYIRRFVSLGRWNAVGRVHLHLEREVPRAPHRPPSLLHALHGR